MEKLLKTGKVKAIGISNFAKKEVDRLIQNTEVVPAVHQMECHPWLQQKEFMDYHKEKGIHVTQYSPFGNQNEIYKAQEKHGKLVDDKTLVEIGKKYGKSSNQVALGEFWDKSLMTNLGLNFYFVLEENRVSNRLFVLKIAWGIAHGRSVIPKSKSAERIAQNFQGVFDLEKSDLEAIDRIDKKLRFNDSSASFGYNFFTDLDGKEN